jgi:restriction endonuclease S subunit
MRSMRNASCKKPVLVLLADIAEILTGYLFRSKLEQEEAGAYGVIQMKDVSRDGRIDWGGLARVNLALVKDSLLLKRGDVLLKAKGSSHGAAVVDRDVQDVIASSHLFILRVRGDAVLPEYLSWYLNEKPARHAIAQASVGTWIRHTPKEGISRLPVPVPSLEIQRQILCVDNLARRERELVDAIQEKREALRNAVLLSVIKNRETGEQ